MIYESLKGTLLALLQVPASPPDPPAGSPESTRTFRASPSFLSLRLIFLGIGAVVSIATLEAVVAMAWVEEGFSVLVAGGLAVGALLLAGGPCALAYFLIRLDYDMRYYIVTDRSLRIRENVWILRESTITFANIQNLKVHQGPLERMLGIANLVFDTAGGGGSATGGQQGGGLSQHHGVFRGIDHAEEVRDQIRVLLRRYRDAGLGDPEDADEPRGADRSAPGGRRIPAPAIERLREIRDELRGVGRALDEASPAGEEE